MKNDLLTHASARLGRWRALAGLLWRTGRGRVVLFGVLVLAAGLLPTAIILLTGALLRSIPGAVEHGLGAPGGEGALLSLAGLMAGLVLLSLCTNALAHLSRVLDTTLALEIHEAVARVTLGTPGLAPLEDPALADELQAVNDAERGGVLRRTAAALSNVATTRIRGAGAFVVLLSFSWWAPLVLAAAWYLTSRVFLRATENGVSFDLSDGAVKLRRAEYVRSLALEAPAAKEVRVFGLGGWVVGRYGDAWLEALGQMWESRRANRGLTAATVLALAASHALVLGWMGLAASRGELGSATLLVLLQAVIATSDLGVIGEWQYFLAQSLAVAERVVAVESRAPAPASAEAEAVAEAEAGGGSAARAGAGVAVSLRGVEFTYRGRDLPTLDGLTLEVPAGQSLAIVGENGAGKSTLIKLLCGLYDPDRGSIVLDGGASPLQARGRGRIGVIFQDFVRYSLPLRENVAFGHLPLAGDPAALEAALRDAGGGRLPARLPRGWETMLSREFEGGAELSGGQWQRVALARALAAVRGGAGLLILDEPTASLDVRAETELFERFLALTRGVTTVLVSHRLSSVRHADRIVVLGGGRVVEDGTHDELMRGGGAYAEMFSLQAERFALAQPAGAAAEEVLDA